MFRTLFTAAVRMPAALILVMGLAFLTTAGARAQDKPAQQENEKGLEGTWEGVLGGQLHVIVTFTKSAEGSYTGTLNSVDQGSKLAIESAKLHGDAVEFQVQRVGGAYKGILIRENEMRGTWTQSAAPAPQQLNFKRKPEPQKEASKTPPNSGEHRIPTPKPFTAPLDISVPIAPWPFEAAGKMHIAYELHITNLGRFDCTLTQIEVVNAKASGHVARGGVSIYRDSLATFSGADLASLITHPGHPDAADPALLAPGSVAVVYLWVPAPGISMPSITHRISMRIGDYPEGLMIETPPLALTPRSPVVIAPPLRGADWAAINGPSNTSLHRRALIPVDGRSYISQRFATDWVQIGADGETHIGDPADNKNYHAYGAEVFAVADGTVTEVKDGLPQNIPGENSRAIPITLETVGGNHIILQIDDNLFAFYAHIQPGSMRVKAGDKVTRGQLLGLVGNSGNSTEPHLHFDICDANSMLACEGVPFAFTSYELEGHGESFKPSRAASADAVKHERDLPLEFDIVRFPEK